MVALRGLPDLNGAFDLFPLFGSSALSGFARFGLERSPEKKEMLESQYPYLALKGV